MTKVKLILPLRPAGLSGGGRPDEAANKKRDLLCERADVGRDVLRFAPRQNHVHPWVRIEQRKGQDVMVS
jgi:hypothetical protein